MKNLPISCWAAEDIPSNKAGNLGYDALSNAELLSIIIGSGNRDLNAVELSRHILSLCDNNLNSLARINQRDLLCLSGMGQVKVARIMAAMELGRRRKDEKEQEKPRLNNALSIYNHFSFLGDVDIEEFHISLLNQNCNVIKDVRISYGGLTETAVDVRIIMRECVVNNATTLVCVHNHPSGSLSPSKADCDLTNIIGRACEIMRIRLLDHVIIGHGNYYSFHENGRI